MTALFGDDKHIPWVDLGKGVKRKVMVYNEELMVVKVQFEPGAVGELHRHPHTQTSYVSAGKFKYTINGREQIMEHGDVCLVPGGQLHGCECLEAGELIDAFTPYREDMI